VLAALALDLGFGFRFHTVSRPRKTPPGIQSRLETREGVLGVPIAPWPHPGRRGLTADHPFGGATVGTVRTLVFPPELGPKSITEQVGDIARDHTVELTTANANQATDNVTTMEVTTNARGQVDDSHRVSEAHREPDVDTSWLPRVDSVGTLHDPTLTL
jgi:hypothetical protein